MKKSGKFLAMLLALSMIFSALSMSVFADSAIESPIVPIPPSQPDDSGWFDYALDEEHRTAVITKFNYEAEKGKEDVTVHKTYREAGVTYSVVGIGEGAFKETGIKKLTVENGITSIGKDAFLNCADLKEINIPVSVISVDPTAFEGTAWLADQPDGVVCVGKVVYKLKGTCADTVVLPADAVSVAEGVFKGQTNLKKVYFPAQTSVGAEAFAGCTDVTFYCYENSPAHLYAQANGFSVTLIPFLELRSGPSKTEFYQREELDVTGMQLIYISEDGENEIPVSPEMVEGYDPNKLGVQTLSIMYEGQTVQFQVTVVEAPVVGDFDSNELVNEDDAVYLLYHLNFPEAFPISQDADFDKNGSVGLEDAFYLLYHVNFPTDYPLA